jgi:hypothetical protein
MSPNRQWLLPVASSASSGGGGGVSSVSGTANQIVSTGGATPVLSISSTFAFPGSATATTQTAGDNSTKLATTAYVDTNPAAQVATVTITSAQFKNIDNTAANAKTIIAAPGAGNMIVVENYSVNLQFQTTAYDTGTGNLQIAYSTGAALTVVVANALGTTNIGAIASNITFSANATLAAQTLKTNQAVVISLSTATKYATGDSPFVITMRYRVLAVA